MAKLIVFALCMAILSGCSHLAGSGEVYPYKGPLTDNSGSPVPPPQYRGAK